MNPTDAAISEGLAFEDVDLAAFGDLFGRLTEAGQQAFIRELMSALERARATNDLRPVRDVIESWYRTMLIRSAPGYDEKMERGTKSRPRRRYSAREIRERLGR